MNKKILKLTVAFLTVMEFGFIYLTYMSYNNRSIIMNDKEYNKNSTFAMYIKNVGDTEYAESDDTVFPTRGYVFNKENSYCEDLDGNIVENILSYSNFNVIVKSNKEVFCYVYFDKTIPLYDVIKKEVTSGTLAKKYTGDTNQTNPHDIYYYATPQNTDAYGSQLLNKWNVVFGGQCWQMLRTTENGGVKLLYNGEYDEEKKCNTERGSHFGYGLSPSRYHYVESEDVIIMDLSEQHDYFETFSSVPSWWGYLKIEGDVINERWSGSTYQNLIGKYVSENEPNTQGYYYYRSTYLIIDYYSDTQAYVVPIRNETDYDNIGITKYNYNNSPVTSVGYMLNSNYKSSDNQSSVTFGREYISSLDINNVYSDSFDYQNGLYSLINPSKFDPSSGYENLIGKYTFFKSFDFSGAHLYSRLSYIYNIDDTYIYYIHLTGDNSFVDNNIEYTISDDIKVNADGTYTLKGNIKTKKVNNINTTDSSKFTCKSTNTTCSKIFQIESSGGSSDYASLFRNVVFTETGNFLYGRSFKYENGKYEIDTSKSTTRIYNLLNHDTKDKLKSTHYTCFNTTGVCDKIHYIYFANASDIKYITLSDGNKVEDVLNEILNESANIKDSTVKSVIDAWYKNNLIKYTEYIDNEEVYCNDRQIISLAGWSPTGNYENLNSINVEGKFHFSNKNILSNLNCQRKIDSFNVTENYYGNGDLTYPIGLPSASELVIINNNFARASKDRYYTNSPIGTVYNELRGVCNDGKITDGYCEPPAASSHYEIRPSIALLPDVGYLSGTGAMYDPYIVAVN